MPYQFKKGDYVRRKGNKGRCWEIAKAMEACGFKIYGDGKSIKRDGFDIWNAICIDDEGDIVRTRAPTFHGAHNEVKWPPAEPEKPDLLANLVAARKARSEALNAYTQATRELRAAKKAMEEALGPNCRIDLG